MTPHELILAAAVLVALVCLRRRRTPDGDEAKRGGAEGAEEDAEDARARDAAFQHYNNFNEAL